MRCDKLEFYATWHGIKLTHPKRMKLLKNSISSNHPSDAVDPNLVQPHNTDTKI